MRILYIIGNGLDVALGLNTRYPDFYDYYCGLEEKDRNEDVIKLRAEIGKNGEDWKDLEFQLGKYTAKVSDKGVMEQICLNLNDSLRHYLLMEQEKVSSEDFERSLFIDHLIQPEMFLLSADKSAVYKRISDQANRDIDVITLNYTDTLEKILTNNKNVVADSGYDASGTKRWTIGTLFHVHGTLAGSPLVGVDNASQIANNRFAEDEDLREILIKPEANSAIKSGIERRCRQLISQANVIVLFGVSLGDTDLTWWKEIGNRLKSSGTVVILFHYDPKMNLEHHEYLIARHERRLRSLFIHQSDCGDDEKAWRDRIFITFNQSFLEGVRKKTIA